MPNNDERKPPESGWSTSRRSFLKGMGFAAGAVTLLPHGGHAPAQDAVEPATPGLRKLGRGPVRMRLRVNGETREVTAEPRATLLDVLREKLDLTGAKEICDRGACGGCTVLADGEAVASCMMLAADAEGAEITTIEGLAADPRFARLFQAYYENDGAQCGYCIPGFVVRSAEVLDATANLSLDQWKEALAGNICRCGTYTKIFDSVMAAAAKGGTP